MNFSKILNHPERDQIISKLTSGDSSRDVADWLKVKYPTDKNKHISYNTLNEFRKEHLNIHGTVLNDLKTTIVKSNEDDVSENLEKVVKKNKTYKDKLNEAVDTQIDWRTKLLQLLNVVETRFAAIFDSLADKPESFRADYVLIQWMQTILDIIEKIRKIEGAPDQIIQHTMSIQIIEEHSALIQEALRQTFAEVDLETSLILMEKLSDNLAKLTAKKAGYTLNEKTIKGISNSFETLSANIESYKGNDDE